MSINEHAIIAIEDANNFFIFKSQLVWAQYSLHFITKILMNMKIASKENRITYYVSNTFYWKTILILIIQTKKMSEAPCIIEITFIQAYLNAIFSVKFWLSSVF